MIDDQLTFSDHIAKITRSCRFALFNTKKISPFLSEHASQLKLFKLLFCPGWTISMLYLTFTINPECGSKIN